MFVFVVSAGACVTLCVYELTYLVLTSSSLPPSPLHSPESDDGLYTEPVEIIHMPPVSTVRATAGLTVMHTTGMCVACDPAYRHKCLTYQMNIHKVVVLTVYTSLLPHSHIPTLPLPILAR